MTGFVILATAALFLLLSLTAMRLRVGSAFHKGLTRCTCAGVVLLLGSLLPGIQVGVNALAIAAVAILHAPGLVLLQVIAMMP